MRTNLLLLTLLMIANAAEAAEAVGKIGYMSGALVAQRTNGTIKVLGPKSEVQAGDMLITAKDSYAQVLMNDGSKMTLRPDSNLRIEAFNFNKGAPKADNAIFQLMKGGFRSVTGLIGKRGNPDAYRVRAASATIGIRGTDFTTRLCSTKDCNEENEAAAAAKKAPIEKAPEEEAIGRVMLVKGEVSARKGSGETRKLSLGALINEGETLATEQNAHAVVAFRDGGRVSLQESTVFHVEKFRYGQAAPQENATLRLLKGGVRVVTGLIGRANRDNYQFRVSTATIGIRGTGFDAWCNGPCVSGATNLGATQSDPMDGAGVYVWAGEVVMITPGGSSTVGVQQAAIIVRDTGKPAPVKVIPRAIIDNNTPRPDAIPADIEKIFGPEVSVGEAGLYVTVHDGQVIVAQADDSLSLGRGETGFASATVLTRLPSPPAFIGVDAGVNLGADSAGRSLPAGGCVVK